MWDDGYVETVFYVRGMGYFAKKGDERENSRWLRWLIVAYGTSLVSSKSGWWLGGVNLLLEFRKPCSSKVIHFHHVFTSRAPLDPSWKFKKPCWSVAFSRKGTVYRIDSFFPRRWFCIDNQIYNLNQCMIKNPAQQVAPERGASGRWRVCQPDVWKLRCWWRRRDVFTPKNVFFT